MAGGLQGGDGGEGFVESAGGVGVVEGEVGVWE